MSVIKRLGNVARGKVLEWSRDDDAGDDAAVARELAELEAAAAAAAAATPTGVQTVTPEPVTRSTDPEEAQRRAIQRAHADGVITEAERDAKLAALDAARYAPPKPKKRNL